MKRLLHNTPTPTTQHRKSPICQAFTFQTKIQSFSCFYISAILPSVVPQSELPLPGLPSGVALALVCLAAGPIGEGNPVQLRHPPPTVRMAQHCQPAGYF